MAVVETKPLLTSHPTNQVRLFHGTAHFSAGVTGSKPTSLQWQHNGDDLPNETNSSLTIPGLGFAHAGTYRLVVKSSRVATVSSTRSSSDELLLLASVGSAAEGGGSTRDSAFEAFQSDNRNASETNWSSSLDDLALDAALTQAI